MVERAEILLVEDDRDIRESLVDILTEEGYAVRAALDGVDALELLRRHATLPHLILLDLMMPRMNGAELCVELSKVPEWAKVPVVIISAHAQARAHAAALGAAATLGKPVKLAELLRTVTRVLGTALTEPDCSIG